MTNLSLNKPDFKALARDATEDHFVRGGAAFSLTNGENLLDRPGPLVLQFIHEPKVLRMGNRLYPKDIRRYLFEQRDFRQDGVALVTGYDRTTDFVYIGLALIGRQVDKPLFELELDISYG